MASDGARLIDELTTLLYSQFGAYRGRSRVACAACHRKADTPELVVHEDDCPVYRLQRAEAANDAVIRANADEIADLEDARDDLEAKVNALTAENARLVGQVAALTSVGQRLYGQAMTFAIQFHQNSGHAGLFDDDVCGVGACRSTLRQMSDWRAALAAGGGEGQG